MSGFVKPDDPQTGGKQRQDRVPQSHVRPKRVRKYYWGGIRIAINAIVQRDVVQLEYVQDASLAAVKPHMRQNLAMVRSQLVIGCFSVAAIGQMVIQNAEILHFTDGFVCGRQKMA